MASSSHWSAPPPGLTLGLNGKLRAILGRILTGLQVLPSVAWVPTAIIWTGLCDATIYTVALGPARRMLFKVDCHRICCSACAVSQIARFVTGIEIEIHPHPSRSHG